MKIATMITHNNIPAYSVIGVAVFSYFVLTSVSSGFPACQFLFFAAESIAG